MAFKRLVLAAFAVILVSLPVSAQTDSQFPQREIAVIDAQAGPLFAVAWSLDGTRLVAGYQNGALRIWDAKTWELQLTLLGGLGYASHVIWSADGSQIASGFEGGTIGIWDANSGETLAILVGHTNEVYTLAWSPDGTRLLSESDDETVRLWDTESGEQLAVFEAQRIGVYNRVWAADSLTFITAMLWQVTIWERDGQREVRQFVLPGAPDEEPEHYASALSPEEQYIAYGDEEGQLAVWDAKSGTLLADLETATEIYRLAWSPDSHYLIGAGYEGFELFDVEQLLEGDGRRTRIQGAIPWFAWSPDSRYIAGGKWSGDDVGTLFIWDAESGEEVAALEGHHDQLYQVAWSPDGRYLASVSEDGTIRIWGE